VTTIDGETKVKIGWAVGILAFLFATAAWANSITNRLETAMTDRFTLTQASEQALRHAIANPGIRVPDPRSPGLFFQVDKTRVSSADDYQTLKGTP